MKVRCKYDELVSVKKLKPFPKNRNRHTDEQIARLALLLKYQGIRAPIVVAGEPFNCIAKGHGTLEAIKFNGGKEAPVVYQDFEDEDQLYAFVQSDNAIASWAELDLSGINSDVGDLGPDFDLDLLGIKDFVLDMSEIQGDADAVPEVPKIAKSKRGELWILGDHRVLCGDATDRGDVERLMGGEKADMVLTDPPYGLGDKWSGGTWATNPMYAEAKKWDHLIDQEAITSILSFAPQVILWGGNYYSLPPSRCWLAWTKTQQMETMADFELAWTNLDRPAKAWEGARNADGKRQHPTQKPVKLLEWCLGFSLDLARVFDPFLGSGSTLIACEKTNRKCFGMEIEPLYIDVILSRWAKFTGKDPVREDGMKWSELGAS